MHPLHLAFQIRIRVYVQYVQYTRMYVHYHGYYISTIGDGVAPNSRVRVRATLLLPTVGI
jgi:hypothetical protein